MKPAFKPPQTDYFVNRFRSAQKTAPKAEGRVFSLLLAKPQENLNSSVQTIAAAAKVSKPTVIRALRRVGYGSFGEFKQQLAVHLSNHPVPPFIQHAFTAETSTQLLSHQLSHNLIVALEHFRKSVAVGAIDKAVKAILQTREQGGQVLLVGVGNSGVVALDAQHKFFHLGVPCNACVDTYQQLIVATMSRKTDLLLLFSASGKTLDLVRVAQVAHKRGMVVVAVTPTGSPLAGNADIVIGVEHQQNSDIELPMISRVLQLLVIDILMAALAAQLGSAIGPQLKELSDNIQNKRRHG